MFVCAVCGEAKVKQAFSQSQWRKRDNGANWPKCKVCKSSVMNPFKRATTTKNVDMGYKHALAVAQHAHKNSFAEQSFDPLDEEVVQSHLLDSDEEGLFIIPKDKNFF